MRIFTRIFLSFWGVIVAAMAMTILFAVSTFTLLQPTRPRSLPLYPIHSCALAAQDVYAKTGQEGIARFLGATRTACSGGIVINLISGRGYTDVVPQLPNLENAPKQSDPKIASVAVRQLSNRAVVATPGPLGKSAPGFVLVLRPPIVFFLNSPRSLRASLVVLLSRLVILLTASGLGCYLLTLYLVKPVVQLGRMAEQLGGGDLTTRIDGPLIRRKDELGEYGRKFNQMAGEIESLVIRYKHFLAHASHELGSPLTRVNIALGLARKKADPALQPELSRIGHETKRLNTLVQELLLLARLESGNELSRETVLFDVAAVIEEACADAGLEADSVGKRIQSQRGESFQVQGYPELLRRALDNVLRNALRFARENGVVTVEFGTQRDKTIGLVSIADDGPGIERGQQDIIFDPFVTLPNRVTGVAEGSGLGLAIARQAVLANQGTISVRNGIPHGLIVSIELPIVGSVHFCQERHEGSRSEATP